MIVSELFNYLKVALVIAFGLIFAAAIAIFIGAIVPFLVPDIFKEVLYLISMYLPFNADAVFSGIGIACSIVLAFMIANKLFNLKQGLLKSA